MSAPSIDGYLSQLRERLAWRENVDDIVDEYADHLWTASERALDRGLSEAEAEQWALETVGPLETIAPGFEGGELGRRSIPTPATRLAGLTAQVVGAGWIVVGAGWFGTYFRPGTWWGHFQAVLYPTIPVLLVLTVAALAGVNLRISRPLLPLARAALAVAGGAVVAAAAQEDDIPLWCGLLAVATALTAWTTRGRTTLTCPAATWPLLGLWWVPTIPAHVVLQVWSNLNTVVIEAGWSVGFVALGLALVLVGRTLWSERAADQAARTPLAAA